MKKKVLSLVLASSMVVSLAACGSSETTTETTTTETATTEAAAETTEAATTEVAAEETATVEGKIAMITDSGDITDESFNQITWETCVAYGEANGIETEYYKPAEDTDEERINSIDLAINEGANVIVMPGYAFGGTLVEVAEAYEDIKFIALDVAAGDILEAGVANAGETYDYNPDNWNLEDYCYMDNLYCAVYQEELSGYIAYTCP